jgi:hypothetical protein
VGDLARAVGIEDGKGLAGSDGARVGVAAAAVVAGASLLNVVVGRGQSGERGDLRPNRGWKKYRSEGSE